MRNLKNTFWIIFNTISLPEYILFKQVCTDVSSSQISDFTAWPDLLQTQDSCSGHICILFGLDDNDETGIYRNCSREGNTGTSTQHSFTFVQNTCKSFLPEEGGRHRRNSELLNMTEDQLGPLQ